MKIDCGVFSDPKTLSWRVSWVSFLTFLIAFMLVNTSAQIAFSAKKHKAKSSAKSEDATTLISQGERRFKVYSRLRSRVGSKSEYEVTVSNIGKGSMYFWTTGGGMQPYRYTARVKNKQFTKTVGYGKEQIHGAGFIENPVKDKIILDGHYMMLSGGTRELAPGEKVTQTLRLYNLPPVRNRVNFIVDIGSPERPYIGPVDKWVPPRESKDPLNIVFH